MSTINSPLSLLPATGSLDGGYSNISTGKHVDLATAAQQFEALMIQQMLSSGHDPDKGWFSSEGEEDQANNQAMEIAQQQFASALAARGGLGLAKLVVSHLIQGNSTNTPDKEGK
jgi:Rod binding domain-containing protein